MHKGGWKTDFLLVEPSATSHSGMEASNSLPKSHHRARSGYVPALPESASRKDHLVVMTHPKPSQAQLEGPIQCLTLSRKTETRPNPNRKEKKEEEKKRAHRAPRAQLERASPRAQRLQLRPSVCVSPPAPSAASLAAAFAAAASVEMPPAVGLESTWRPREKHHGPTNRAKKRANIGQQVWQKGPKTWACFTRCPKPET